jgi:hypothetical protein
MMTIPEYDTKIHMCACPRGTVTSSGVVIWCLMHGSQATTRCASASCFQVFVLDRLIEDDGIRGDEYGDFDKNTVAEERARLKREKVTPGHRVQPALNCSIRGGQVCNCAYHWLSHWGVVAAQQLLHSECRQSQCCLRP